MKRVISAPGKLFLSGEYAVLWGGLSRIAAVGPRLQAVCEAEPDRNVHVLLEDGRLSGEATHVGAHWSREVPADFHFVAWAVDYALRASGKDGPGFKLAIAPSEQVQGFKLGLGGSARATALAVEAVRWVLDQRWDTLKLSLLAHALAQGGKGSGGDVAAVVAGGIVRYRRYALGKLAETANSRGLMAALEDAPPVDLVRIPKISLPLAYVFAGQSASTRVLIGEVEKNLAEAGRAKFVADSDAQGQALETALVKGDYGEAARASSELHRLLCSLGPLETDGIRRVLALAATSGCAGKISGAGGGDGCILICPDEAARTRVIDSFTARNMLAFALELQPGLQGDASAEPRLLEWMKA